MDFIKKNSTMIGIGVAGGLLGAVALYSFPDSDITTIGTQGRRWH